MKHSTLVHGAQYVTYLWHFPDQQVFDKNDFLYKNVNYLIANHMQIYFLPEQYHCNVHNYEHKYPQIHTCTVSHKSQHTPHIPVNIPLHLFM